VYQRAHWSSDRIFQNQEINPLSDEIDSLFFLQEAPCAPWLKYDYRVESLEN
jgi:hypothetical protein